jgi:hypothetical protein
MLVAIAGPAPDDVWSIPGLRVPKAGTWRIGRLAGSIGRKKSLLGLEFVEEHLGAVQH